MLKPLTFVARHSNIFSSAPSIIIHPLVAFDASPDPPQGVFLAVPARKFLYLLTRADRNNQDGHSRASWTNG